MREPRLYLGNGGDALRDVSITLDALMHSGDPEFDRHAQAAWRAVAQARIRLASIARDAAAADPLSPPIPKENP